MPKNQTTTTTADPVAHFSASIPPPETDKQDAPAVQVEETDAPAADPHAQLRQMIEKLGGPDVHIEANEWPLLIELKNGNWLSAINSGELKTTQNYGMKPSLTGATILQWLASRKYELTPLGDVLRTIRADEVVPTNTIADAKRIENRFGIKLNHVTRDDNGNEVIENQLENAHYVTGDRLIEWLESPGVRPHYTPTMARIAMRQRRQETQDREAETRKAERQAKDLETLAGGALALAEQNRRRAEAETLAATERRRQELWREYGEIIVRHGEPKSSDVERLAELCTELNLTRGQLDADTAALEEIPRLEAAHAELGKREAEHAEATEAFRTLYVRLHDEERETTQRKEKTRRAYADACHAPKRIANIKRERWYLFSDEPAEAVD